METGAIILLRKKLALSKEWLWLRRQFNHMAQRSLKIWNETLLLLQIVVAEQKSDT